jgi:hypothetical protein
MELSSSRDAFWPDYLTVACGLWLVGSGLSSGYEDPRMRASDIVSGLYLVILCVIALRSKMSWIRWVMAATGLWLTLAPLVLWSASAAAYANGNLIGTLVIISSVIIPSLPERDDSFPAIPPGWSYNPSSWAQRTPIIGLAFTGFLLAKYLAAYQLGHINIVWDPFFGDGTKNILRSDVSRAFPVSDAGLGAWSYLLDALSGAYGGERRWRTHPWVVILFGLMVIPPGVTSIVLVVLQPIAVGSWCTICLATAMVMLFMIPPAIDEVIATTQFLIQSKRQGEPLWRTFWQGGGTKSPMPLSADAIPIGLTQQSGGLAPPWNLVACAILGVWLMVAPSVFEAHGLAGDFNHLLGALIITFAVIATAEVARPIRFINVLFGAGLAAGVWFLDGGSPSFRWSSASVGLLLTALSLPLGKIQGRYGSYDRMIRWAPGRKDHSHEQGESRAA